MAYVLQSGLSLGQPYTVANYPTSLNPATDGLRNIAGKVNSDGTVTIWATTSTISANGDPGADPNKLVSVTDVIANTSPATAATEAFTTLRTANAGEVLRGVSLAPTGTTAAVNVPLVLAAANPGATAIAPGSMAIVAGQNLATTIATQTTPYPSAVAGTSVSIVDANGATVTAPLISVSPTQLVILVPTTTAPGLAQLTVTNGTATQVASNVEISEVAPGIMTMNGLGLPAAQAIQVAADQSQTSQAVYSTNSDGAVVPNPIVMASPGNTYLVLYGSGIAAGGTALTSATVNGLTASVVYAGPAGGANGLDQVNILLPAKAAGAGNVNVQVTTEGIALNPVQVTIK
jgi:uncharacterized protein (TIGR03437 family)